jgi:4-hydroxybenzoate polyprenyltransferase
MDFNLKLWISAGRVKHYIKGIVIFSVFFLDFSSININNFFKIFILFLGFGFFTSVVYIINDLHDSDEDAIDNFVKTRPYASGLITRKFMISLSVFCFFLGFTLISLLGFFKSNIFLPSLLISFYMVINLAYSRFKLKRHKLLGMFLVGLGFPIRFILGFLLLRVEIPPMFPLMIFLLAILVISGKRHYRELNNASSNDWGSIFSSIMVINLIFYFIFLLSLIFLYEVDLLILLTWPIFLGLMLRFRRLVKFKKGFVDLSLIFIFDRLFFLQALILISIFLFFYSK